MKAKSKTRTPYMVNLEFIRGLNPCARDYTLFLRYMGGLEKLQSMGDFSPLLILPHNEDHFYWVIGRMGPDGDRIKALLASAEASKEMQTARIAFVEKQLSAPKRKRATKKASD